MSEHECGGCCGGHDHGDHHHHEEHSGGCGGCHGCGSQASGPVEVHISPEEEQFLQKLAQCPFLPVAEFLLKSSKSDHLTNMALSPVYLETGKETLPQIKAIGQVLLSLEEKELISLDYDSPLEGCDQRLFTNSDAFHLLEQTVEEGKASGEFLFDAPVVEFGSICLTAVGDLVIEQLDFI